MKPDKNSLNALETTLFFVNIDASKHDIKDHARNNTDHGSQHDGVDRDPSVLRPGVKDTVFLDRQPIVLVFNPTVGSRLGNESLEGFVLQC